MTETKSLYNRYLSEYADNYNAAVHEQRGIYNTAGRDISWARKYHQEDFEKTPDSSFPAADPEEVNRTWTGYREGVEPPASYQTVGAARPQPWTNLEPTFTGTPFPKYQSIKLQGDHDQPQWEPNYPRIYPQQEPPMTRTQWAPTQLWEQWLHHIDVTHSKD